ncbi:DUF3120 domain-containing protein [Trichothermofontia sichuanensis B231]|uniref:DUF3120 domain-containing protein n=1 Tax=Trichothermofontia sichuanensis TaxID=3045816 RepID=UPI00224744FF|nr:DUF3120 domain-containing protein [Trichothermofontia sichuanensis B231]
MISRPLAQAVALRIQQVGERTLPTLASPALLAFMAAIFLVSVPVFVQAPLVRGWPWLSLGVTGLWWWLSRWLLARPATHHWGDLLWGFSWTWLAGSLYWGWLRWEPVWHLPLEAIALPLVLVCLLRQRLMMGSFFYSGSLLGTAMTDMYFYLVDLLPDWRRLMQVEPNLAFSVLQQAVTKVQTPWGYSWAALLGSTLAVIGLMALCQRQLPWRVFSGAVLGTILVDGLFWLLATIGQ